MKVMVWDAPITDELLDTLSLAAFRLDPPAFLLVSARPQRKAPRP